MTVRPSTAANDARNQSVFMQNSQVEKVVVHVPQRTRDLRTSLGVLQNGRQLFSENCRQSNQSDI